jgi:thiosulfate/3-mercaptopyruvate sulfurtransferase
MSTLRYDTVIEPTELHRIGADPDVAVIDCRFDLARPAWGAQAYAEGHIPRALYASLDHDLSAPVSAASGRHPLPDPARFAATLGGWGIDARTQVIAYDQQSGAIAARLWWLLRWMGHRCVAVLDGGFAAWCAESLPVTGAPAARAARTFRGTADAAAVTDAAGVAHGLEHGALALIDVRSAERFAGHNETLDPVSGHIPGARNHPYPASLDARGRFLAPAELKRQWRATLGADPPERAVLMCGSGVTACHGLLALERAGLPGARLYAGSWSEWIRDPRRAVTRA